MELKRFYCCVGNHFWNNLEKWVTLLHWRECSCIFCMITLKMMRLQLDTLTVKFTELWLFLLHVPSRKSGGGIWFIFPFNNFVRPKVKQAMLKPKQDITLSFFALKSLKSQTGEHKSLFIPDLQPLNQQYCPSCFVSIATAALNFAYQTCKFKVAKLCPWLFTRSTPK